MRVQSRRTDVLPLTSEVPAVIALTWLLAGALALPVGQGLAYLVVGRSFAWPGQKVGESIFGLLSGEPGRGLPGTIANQMPPIPLVYCGVAVVELVLAVVAISGLAWWSRTAGPAAEFGLASSREVEAVLGRRALRRRRTTIRPDLGASSRRLFGKSS